MTETLHPQGEHEWAPVPPRDPDHHEAEVFEDEDYWHLPVWAARCTEINCPWQTTRPTEREAKAAAREHEEQA